MKRDTAFYIWNCIQNHSDNFSEDRGEWMYGLGIKEKDLDDFMAMVDDAINHCEVD